MKSGIRAQQGKCEKKKTQQGKWYPKSGRRYSRVSENKIGKRKAGKWYSRVSAKENKGTAG